MPERIGRRPVISAARLGVHWFSTLKFVSFSPSPASRSMRGVGVSRMPPL
jgi:hypothetical protein